MWRRTAAVVALLVPFLALVPLDLARAAPGGWSWPLDGRELAGRFDRPADRYGPGHRGVDLPGAVGAPVRAVAAGRVTFAGRVGGVGVVTVDHGAERSTYQPVEAVVSAGDAVADRQVIGTLLGEHSHCAAACLHLGRRAGDEYLDPLGLLGGSRFVLISPDGEPPRPPPGPAGDLLRPVGGPVTSPFGLRVHPVTGVRKLHDGTDFGVPCGTPVRAAAGGVVTAAGSAGAYGRRVTVRHGPALETSYAHLSSIAVPVGARLSAGQVIGRSGTTGLSTGCHLHFMVRTHGRPTDPMSSL
jgi:murein DD-endopeptidase MepM/ murein hydrolase activator NlpD